MLGAYVVLSPIVYVRMGVYVLLHFEYNDMKIFLWVPIQFGERDSLRTTILPWVIVNNCVGNY